MSSKTKTTGDRVRINLEDTIAAFKKADKDGSGTLDVDEIASIEEKFGLAPQISKKATDWRDGTINIEEFITMLKENKNLVQEGKKAVRVSLDEAMAAFKKADVDGSGTIGFEEIGVIERKFNLPMNISGNAKDWSDGKIDVEEFIGMLKKNKNLIEEDDDDKTVRVSLEDAMAAFKMADVDGSGTIGFSEIGVIERKFDLPMKISGSAKDWSDGVIDLGEYLGMLKKNGSLIVHD
eukprot:g3555.t1